MQIQNAAKRAFSLALAGAITLSAAAPSFATEGTGQDLQPEITEDTLPDSSSEATGDSAEQIQNSAPEESPAQPAESMPEDDVSSQAAESEEVASQPNEAESMISEEEASSDSPDVYAAPQDPAHKLSVDDIESIQAYTDATFYGTGVVEVDVTYKQGTDLSGVSIDSYILEDRGSLDSKFGKIDLEQVSIKDNVVALTILRDFDATDANKMIYTGSNKEGSRQRNSFGVYVTGSWYRDTNGKIVIGEAGQQGYQARECLELRLRHADEDESKALWLADENGHYTDANKWQKTVDRQFGENGFHNLYDLKIPSTGNSGDNGDAYVQGYYYIPENYDASKGIVFTLQGQGISFWKLEDGINNAGTGIMFDSATTSWANQGAIVVNIHDRSTTYTLPEGYDFVLDDVNVMKYFIDQYKITGPIVLQGNSRGTMASDIIIKALAGCEYDPAEQRMGTAKSNPKMLDKSQYNFTIDTYICQNGTFGGTIWDDETGDWERIAKTGLRAWIFEGEQDTNNIETFAKWNKTLTSLGMPTNTARLTGLTSDLNYPWGESDHSATRINGWYFADTAYYGPNLHLDDKGNIVYDTKLNDGETYTLEGRGAAGENSKKDYEYIVYDDSFHSWALREKATAYNHEPVKGDFTRAKAAQDFYDYFGWSHRDEYNDIWSPEMVQFQDVSSTTPEWMAIECVLQQGLVDKAENYRPSDVITYAEAVDMLARAYSVDAAAIKNASGLDLQDNDGLSSENWNTLFSSVKKSFVAPVQALPIANTNDGAPRRYVKLWTPEGEENTTIYFKKTVSTEGYDENIVLDINEAKPYDYVAANKADKSLDATLYTQIYTVNEDGYIKEDYSGNTDTYITYKTVSVNNSTHEVSAERIYKWHLHRPASDDITYGGYTAELIHEKTATSPAVYQICRDAESLRAMAWYIEGQSAGVVMDALQTNAYNKDGTKNQWDLKEFVDKLATKPYSLVVGHAHPDHDAQAANFINAGIPTYCNDRNWSSLKSVLKCSIETEEQNNARQAAVLNIDEGDSFDLGGCTLDVYTLPGHLDNLVILADRANGWVFSTDIYGCTRSGSADNVNVSGIPADLLLSLAQQNHSEYIAKGVKVSEVYTGHDEVPLTGTILDNFEKCLQNVIDYGDDATSYTLRGGNNKMYARTSMVGDVWKSGTDWLSLLLSGTKGDQTPYLSNAETALYMSDPANTGLNYNYVNGVQQVAKYSVLSNVEVSGGTFHGVDISWKNPTTIEWAGEKDVPINYTLHDRFNPWYYNYTITADKGNVISINATTMATKAAVTRITLDGKQVNSLQNLSVKNGSVVTVTVTAPDQVTTSTYNFTVEAKQEENTPSKSSSSSSASSSSNSSKQETVYHSMTAIAHEGGTISSLGVFGVVEGTSKYYEISPNAGCTVARVIVDGVDIGSVTNYTFNNIHENHTIEVFFSGNGISNTGRSNPQTGIY